MSKQQFKAAKKQSKKQGIQDRFQQKNVIDDTFEETQASQHENLVHQYLSDTKLKDALLSGLKASIQGDVVPKNPWCEVSRALGAETMKTSIQQSYEKLKKSFNTTPTTLIEEYSLHKISYTYKFKEVILNEDNELEERVEERTFTVFGFAQHLEYIFLPKLKEFYTSMKDLIVSFSDSKPTGTITVANSLSAGYVLKSNLIIYPNSHPKDVEINCECFIDSTVLQNALDMFANFVYEDCVSINNKNNFHFIKEFIMYTYDDELKENIKTSWKMKNIAPVNKQRFLKEVIEKCEAKSSIYWKGYCRVPAFEYLDLNENMQDILKDPSASATSYQYIEVYKNYNMHFHWAGLPCSYAAQPMGSLIKGVFFREDHAKRYASYFYKPTQNPLVNENFALFIKNQLSLVLKKWTEQNISACAWELFYVVLYIQQADAKRELLESIIEIITSDYSALLTCTKYNRILQMVIETYWQQKNTKILLPTINGTYKIYREYMFTVFGNSNGSDIIRYREFIFRLFREMEDSQGGFVINENSMLVLKCTAKVTKYMGVGNLQRVGIVTRNVSLYIEDALKKNNMLSDTLYMTYEEFQQLKVPKKMMHVSQEVIRYKEQKNAEYKTDADIEDAILLQFLNEYDLFDNLYFILRDIFFGKQLPTALPTAQFRVEVKAIKYQLFELTRKEVGVQLCNELHEGLRDIKINDPNLELYQFITENMDELDLKPIWGLRQCIYYASTFEISGLKNFLDQFPWQKALKRPIPSSYQVQPIMTISTTNLFHDSGVLGRTYGEWDVDWDWVIKGASYPHAQQIFIDTILKYVAWLQLTTDLSVIGFYLKRDKDPFLLIDDILKAEDLTEIKQVLLSAFSENSLVYFRVILKIETRYKAINYLINLHFIDPSKKEPQTLLQQELAEHYCKVFFSKVDFQIWNKLYPYSDGTIKRLISQQQKTLFYAGSLNDTMKLELIKFYIQDTVEIFLTMSRILFSYSESFYNLSKEANLLGDLFQQVQNPKAKYKIQDFKEYFIDVAKQIRNELCAYDNIYFDSVGATVLNIIESARQAFNGGTSFQSYANKMYKVADMCTLISDSVILTYRQMLLDDYGYTLLWLPKQR